MRPSQPGPSWTKYCSRSLLPISIHVVSLLEDDSYKAIAITDPAVTCLSVRADGDYALLAAGHHDGSASLTQLSPADTGVVAPQWTRHLHDGPVTDILLDAEEQVITGGTDRRVRATRVATIRSDTLTPDAAESTVQSLHLTLRCKGVRFDGASAPSANRRNCAGMRVSQS